MDLIKAIILGICGIIAVYVGIKTIAARRIPIVYEGEEKPLAWIKGREAVALGVVTCVFGVIVLLDVFEVIHLF